MDKYFTEEYVELCRNEKIRSLKNELEVGDWFLNPLNNKPSMVRVGKTKNTYWYSYLWIPTEDDLDDEIFKILKEWSKDGEDINYSFEVSFSEGKMSAFQLVVDNRDGCHVEMDTNPLVARIKTLISLLEAK